MTLEIAWTIYKVISFASCPLLILVLPPYLLPTTLSAIPYSTCLRPPTISLIICLLIKSGLVGLDLVTHQRGGGRLPCDASTILNTFFTTATISHLSTISYTTYIALATPKNPTPSPFSTTRTAALISATYIYALIPVIPTLVDWAAHGKSDNLGIWWGFYCRPHGDWWRFVRIGILAIPCMATLVLTFLTFASLYSTEDHPTPGIRTSTRDYLATATLTACSLFTIAYLVCEQVWWSEDWWPRAFECAPGVILLIVTFTDRRIFTAYFSWLRLRRPPSPAPSDLNLELAETDSEAYVLEKRKRTSSFAALLRRSVPKMPTPIWAVHARQPQLGTVVYPATPFDVPSSTPAFTRQGRNVTIDPVPLNLPSASADTDTSLSFNDEPRSPPFIYSVAESSRPSPPPDRPPRPTISPIHFPEASHYHPKMDESPPWLSRQSLPSIYSLPQSVYDDETPLKPSHRLLRAVRGRRARRPAIDTAHESLDGSVVFAGPSLGLGRESVGSSVAGTNAAGIGSGSGSALGLGMGVGFGVSLGPERGDGMEVVDDRAFGRDQTATPEDVPWGAQRRRRDRGNMI